MTRDNYLDTLDAQTTILRSAILGNEVASYIDTDDILYLLAGEYANNALAAAYKTAAIRDKLPQLEKLTVQTVLGVWWDEHLLAISPDVKQQDFTDIVERLLSQD